MDRQVAVEKFNHARKMFLDGFYEEALVVLNELCRMHPNAFNFDFPRLQCLKRLERFEEVKELYGIMATAYVQPDQLQKLRQVGEWITVQEGSGFDGLGGIQLGADPTALGADLMGDLLGLSEPRRKPLQAKPSPVPASSSHWKTLTAIVSVVAVLAAGVFILPGMLKTSPQFTAGVVIGLPFSNIEGKFFRKTGRINRTELMGQIVIINEDKVYVIIPDERKYSISGADEVMGNSFFSEIGDINKWAATHNVKKVGQEVLYGLTCDIYQGFMSLTPAMPPTNTKMWYSSKLDFPVKSETISTGMLGRMVMFLKDIRLGPLADDLFVVPAGYTLVSAEETEELGASMGIGFGPGVAGASPTPPPLPPSSGTGLPPPLPPSPGTGLPPSSPPSPGTGLPPSSPPPQGMGTPPPGGGVPDNSKNIDPQAMQQLMQQLNVQR